MNKFYTKIFSFFVLLALALPGGLFASANENYSTTNASQSNQAVLVNIVTFGPLPQVSVSKPKIDSTSVCVPTPTANDTLLGGTLDINLNQPANCFKMVEGKAVALQNLKVATGEVVPKIIVLGTGNFFLKNSLARNLPNLPEATEIFVALGLLVAFFQNKKSVQYEKTKKVEAVYFQPTVFDLLVMRC